MAQAARNLYAPQAQRVGYAPQPARAPRPDIRVLPGKGRDARRNQGVPPIALSAFKAVVVLAVMLAVVLCARVWLSVATVQSLESAAALNASIDDARSYGTALEIQHSVLASPTRIEKKAAQLGMTSPKTTTYLTVSVPAKVVSYGDGRLSVCGTLASVVDAAAAAR